MEIDLLQVPHNITSPHSNNTAGQAPEKPHVGRALESKGFDSVVAHGGPGVDGACVVYRGALRPERMFVFWLPSFRMWL